MFTSLVAGGNGRGSELNQRSGPAGICLGPAGELYIADFDNHRVTRWAPGAAAGEVVAQNQDGHVHITVSRVSPLMDLCRQLGVTGHGDVAFIPGIVVHFENEDGIDEGGLTREALRLALLELVDVSHGLFAKTEQQEVWAFCSGLWIRGDGLRGHWL